MNSAIVILLMVCTLRPQATIKEYDENFNKILWYVNSARTGMKYMESYRSKETWIYGMIKNVEAVCKEYPLLPFAEIRQELLGMLGKCNLKIIKQEALFDWRVYKMESKFLRELESAA